MSDDSILTTVKQMLGLEEDYTAFDTDIIVGINAAIFNLHQLGVANSDGFVVSSDYSETWADLFDTSTNYDSIIQYVYLKTRSIFDPPTSSSVANALTNQMRELEWRLCLESEMEDSDE